MQPGKWCGDEDDDMGGCFSVEEMTSDMLFRIEDRIPPRYRLAKIEDSRGPVLGGAMGFFWNMPCGISNLSIRKEFDRASTRGTLDER